MNRSRIMTGLFILMTMIAINVSAQEPLPKRCKAVANEVYFVDSGKMVTELHPGSNGGNGYQLNILGENVDKFQVIKEPYMTAVYLVPNYTNATSAKWQIFFAYKQAQVISKVRMSAPDCTGRLVREYPLTQSVTLLNQ